MNLSLLRDFREKRSIIERVHAHTRTHITTIKESSEMECGEVWLISMI